MDAPIPKCIDPAYKPDAIFEQCYECGQDFAPLSEMDNLCEDCHKMEWES